jgi:hypothetical protein
VTSRRGLLLGTTAVCIALFALAYMLPSTTGNGSEMDEGAVVAYSARVLDGAVPHRDFLTFYGPGNLWTVAGAFEVFGEGVTTERAVGVAYRLAIVLALFALGLELGGLLGAVLAGVTAAVLSAEELIWAYASYGALAFALVGLALLSRSVRVGPVRRPALWSAAAGVAGGMAILVRFDFVPAVALGAVPLVLLLESRRRVWYAVGLLGTVALYLPYLAVVGPERVRRLSGDIVASASGRRLPVPAPGSYVGWLLALSLVATAFFVVLGVMRWQGDRSERAARILVSAGVFNVCLLPLVLSRADVYHVRPFALVPLSLLPAGVLLLIRSSRLEGRLERALVVAVGVVAALAIVNHGMFTADRVRALRDVRHAYRGFLDGRDSARAVVARTRALASPGDSLFVGPKDLRRTNYGPTFIYSLLPSLRPASYYMEMNPNTANRPGSGLADDLRRADWLILSTQWDNWDEPNNSTTFRSPAPNEVVRSLFCVRFASGGYSLYQRCRGA